MVLVIYASNILRQVDVISDKSDLDFFGIDNVAGLSNWRLHIAHTLPLAPHKVFLSSDGFEDPQAHIVVK